MNAIETQILKGKSKKEAGCFYLWIEVNADNVNTEAKLTKGLTFEIKQGMKDLKSRIRKYWQSKK